MRNYQAIEQGLPNYHVLSRRGDGTGRMLLAKKDYTTEFSFEHNKKPWTGFVETLEVRSKGAIISCRNNLPEDPFCTDWPEIGDYHGASDVSDPRVAEALGRILSDKKPTPFQIDSGYMPIVAGLFRSQDFMARTKNRDEELVLSYLAGGKASMDLLIESYSDTIRRLASRIDVPLASAEDKQQIARMAFLHAVPCYRGRNNAIFKTYIERCIKNALLNEYTRMMRHKRKPDTYSLSMEDTVGSRAVEKQIHEDWLIEKREEKEEL